MYSRAANISGGAGSEYFDQSGLLSHATEIWSRPTPLARLQRLFVRWVTPRAARSNCRDALTSCRQSCLFHAQGRPVGRRWSPWALARLEFALSAFPHKPGVEALHLLLFLPISNFITPANESRRNSAAFERIAPHRCFTPQLAV